MLKFATILFIALIYSAADSYGQSLFLERPVKPDIETNARYLYAEPHISDANRSHGGVDYRIRYDTVYSAADGVIDFLFYDANEDNHLSCGNYMFIKTEWEGRDLFMLYCHLEEVLVEEGQQVEAGDPVGISGNTGFSTGPHLHFELRVDVRNIGPNMRGKRRNPELYLALDGTGVIYGNVPGADRTESGAPGANNSTRVDISPHPKPRPPYTTYGYTLTYNFRDQYAGSDDDYQENYAIGNVVPGNYTITALNGQYERDVTVEAGQIVNADQREPPGIPVVAELHDNYPNPFNSSTTIEFTVGVQKNVRIDVYDVMGRKVQTLVNGIYPQGTHPAHFNAQALASGIYIYQMVTRNRTYQKKMLYMK